MPKLKISSILIAGGKGHRYAMPFDIIRRSRGVERGYYAGKSTREKNNKGLKSPSTRQSKGLQTSGLKPVKKTVKKTTKKSARDDIEDDYKELKKLQDETWAAIRENQKNIFGIKTTLDFFIEHIMSIDILKKFKKFGFSFDRLTEIKFAQGVYAEISAVYDNCIQAVVVIVTNTLLQSDIDDHLVRMEKIRKYADEHGDKRQFMGAMAVDSALGKTQRCFGRYSPFITPNDTTRFKCIVLSAEYRPRSLKVLFGNLTIIGKKPGF